MMVMMNGGEFGTALQVDTVDPDARPVAVDGWDAVISPPGPPPVPAAVAVATGKTATGCNGCKPAVAVTDIPPPSQDIAVVVGTRDWLLWLLIVVAALVALYMWGRS